MIFILFTFYLLDKNDLVPHQITHKIDQILDKKIITQNMKIDPQHDYPEALANEEFVSWIGKSSHELTDHFGEPLRRDLSAYGYTWWIYTDEETEYVQFGIDNDQIETIYMMNDEDKDKKSNLIGQHYEEVNDQFSFTSVVHYREGLSTYNMSLTTEDLLQRPLVKVADDLFIQFYFDTFTNELSSLRILTAETLLKHTPYEIEYRGDLPLKPELTDEEWEEIERGAEQQIFSLTNILRKRHQKPKLIWNDDVHAVALSHSKDMHDENYFSHQSIDGRHLKDRLAEKDVVYQTAGENIAAQYPDGPAAIEGWLNSEGHREALLEDRFKDLGVGVYRLYFTQNFLTTE